MNKTEEPKQAKTRNSRSVCAMLMRGWKFEEKWKGNILYFCLSSGWENKERGRDKMTHIYFWTKWKEIFLITPRYTSIRYFELCSLGMNAYFGFIVYDSSKACLYLNRTAAWRNRYASLMHPLFSKCRSVTLYMYTHNFIYELNLGHPEASLHKTQRYSTTRCTDFLGGIPNLTQIIKCTCKIWINKNLHS